MQDTTLLIDGNYLLHRIMKSPGHQDMTHNGEFTGGVYGFIRSLGSMMNKFRGITSVVVFWDGSKSTRRMALHGLYKDRAGHDPLQVKIGDKVQELSYIDTFYKQYNMIVAILILLKVRSVKIDKEADDVIGRVVRIPEEYDLSPTLNIIATDDKDYHQNVSATCHLFRPMAEEYITLENFFDHTQLKNPHEYLVYHSLSGDSSDNIVNIKGWGWKTIQKVIASLEITPETDIINISSQIGEYCKKLDTKTSMKWFEPIEGGLLGYQLFIRNFALVDMSMEEFTEEEDTAIYNSISARLSPIKDAEIGAVFHSLGFNSFLKYLSRFLEPFTILK